MRLNQLARQLEIEPSKVVKFLEDKGVTIINTPNTKIEDEQVELIREAFPKAEPEIIIENEPVIEEKDELPSLKTEEPEIITPPEDNKKLETDPIQETSEEPIEEKTLSPALTETESTPIEQVTESETTKKPEPINDEIKKTTTVSEILNSLEEETNLAEKPSEPENYIEATLPEDDTEVTLIKAPKINLPGITVLGKIDLPEKPKKEETKTEETKTEEKAEPTKTVKSNISDTSDPQEEYIHPNKRTKIRKEENTPETNTIVKKKRPKKKTKNKKENIKPVKAAQKRKKPKTPEPSLPDPKATQREKRKRKKDREKEKKNQPQKSLWKRIIDALS